LGRAAWSQIQSLFITTFNLKHNRDTALAIICYGKIKVSALGFYSAFYDYVTHLPGWEAMYMREPLLGSTC
jgi:hypothetical protein